MSVQSGILTAERLLGSARSRGVRYGRSVLPVFVAALLLWPSTRELTVGVLADAFLQVSVFVFSTLLVYEWGREVLNSRNLGKQVLLSRWQVPWAAFLGGLPGCGGAIIVVTQFVRGGMSFGSLVAVLTATMGDAAFVLLVARPSEGLAIIFTGMLVGTVTGLLIDKFQPNLFRVKLASKSDAKSPQVVTVPRNKTLLDTLQVSIWRWTWPLTLGIALLLALQYEPNGMLGLAEGTVESVGALACLAALSLWALNRADSSYEALVAEEDENANADRLQRVVHATHFVTAWVVVAFLLFEISIMATGFEPEMLLSGLGLWLPLVGILVGLLPGCGPQILMTSLYLQGAVPFAALLGNAISNDGDALFPAIALAPKAAIVATLYSTIPAFLVAYGYTFLVT